MKKYYIFFLLLLSYQLLNAEDAVRTTIEPNYELIGNNSIRVSANYEILNPDAEFGFMEYGFAYAKSDFTDLWAPGVERINIYEAPNNSFSASILNLENNTNYYIKAFVMYSIMEPYEHKTVFSENLIVNFEKQLTLWALGNNNKGQLGIGNNINKDAPFKINSDKDWKEVKAGKEHTLAIKNDGSLWAWGDNTYGQLGDGTNENRNAPVRIGTENNWSSIACGYYHSIGIKSDGSLWLWGRNHKGQLGNGSNNNSNIPIRVGEQYIWKAAAGGEEHTLALAYNQEYNSILWTWGNNTYGQLGNMTNTSSNIPQQVYQAYEYKAIASGQFHSLGLRFSNRLLFSFGYNNKGQLGDDTYQNRNEPFQILPNQNVSFTTLSCGKDFNIAIDTGGNIYAWGNNQNGQLGDGTIQNRNWPVLIGNGPWKNAACGEDFSYAIKADGSLWKWGGDFVISPLREGNINKWVSVSAGGGHILLLKDSDNDIDAPQITEIPNEVMKETQFTVSWNNIEGAESYLVQIADNSDFSGELIGIYPTIMTQMNWSNPNPGVYSFRVRAINGVDSSEWSEVKFVKIIRTFKTGNALTGWGDNKKGQLALEEDQVNYPAPISYNYDWSQVCASNNQTYAVRKNILWAVGENTFGQLGDSTIANKKQITKVYGGQNWRMAAGGENHTLAIKNDNTLWAWGDNQFGQLGDESRTGKITQTQVFGNSNDWNQVFAAKNYSFAIKLDGSLWHWGADFTINETQSYSVPRRIGDHNDWKFLACGEKHTLALKNDGSLWAWGRNENYQLGDSSIPFAISPVRIGTDNNWEYIAAGKDFSFGIKNDGSLWAWGSNVSGQLGDGTNIPKPIPAKVPNVKHCFKVACGEGHTVVLHYDGTLSASGKNESGQLGIGSYQNTADFVKINPILNDHKYIIAGANHTLAFSEAEAFQLPENHLLSPKNDTLLKTNQVEFLWYPINLYAKSYALQIFENIIDTLTAPAIITKENGHLHNFEEYGKTYYWRVKYYTDTDSSDWSEIWKFTIAENFSEKIVELKSPENQSIDIPIDYYLQWFELEEAEVYLVQVSTNEVFTADIQNDFTETYSYQLGNKIVLENNTKYFWRVKAVNGADLTNWCEPWNFTTNEKVNPIKAPQLVSPADNAMNVAISPTLSWESVSGADSYRVQVSKSEMFTNLVFEQSLGVTNIAAPQLEYDTYYYWRVNTKIGADSSDWSLPNRFKTAPLTDLDSPKLTYPENNAQNVSLSPTFTWLSVQGANSYILQISKDNAFSTLVSEQELTNTNYTGATLEFNSNYYWRVQAKTGLIISDWSEVYTFKTVTNFTLATPDLTAPVNNTEDLQPTVLLRWTAVNGANEYEVIVSKESNFASTVINQKTNNNSFTAKKLELLTKYYWKIKALNGEEISDWSEVWNFTTSATLILPTVNLKVSCDTEYKPGEVQKEIPLAIPIVVESLENYEASMKPDSLIGYFRVRRSMFYPDLNSNLGSVKCEFADSYILNNKITVTKAVENLSPSAIAFHLPGWVLLGDKETSPVILDSVKWIWKNNPDIEFYTNIKNDTIRLKVSNGIELRTISLKEAVSIINIYPMPLSSNSLEIEIMNKSNSSKIIKIDIYDQAGKLIEDMGSRELGSGTNILKLKLAEAYSSGTYIMQLSEQGEVINKQIIINK